MGGRRLVKSSVLALAACFALAADTAPLPAPIDPADYIAFDERRARLGRLLFYDKILSGNRNIACGTCHDHDHGTSDGLSLGAGEGASGLGRSRRFGTGRNAPPKRVPRNAPALFNLGHASVRTLFADGRVGFDDAPNGGAYGNGFSTPAEEWLPKGLTNLAAVQALFPMTSATEMGGQPHENDVAAARRERIDHVWPVVARRVAAVPEYVELFQDAFVGEVTGPGDVTMARVATAIGDFVISEWRSHDAPFDAHLAGDATALTAQQTRGMALFYGPARCGTCHSGALFTDNAFHALALPPFGPGRTRAFDPYARDVGRMAETDRLEDAYRFRTPSLRNVALTAPYGHNGAYTTLTGIVRHHLDPLAALEAWDRAQVVLPDHAPFRDTDFAVWEDVREMARLRARVDIRPVQLTDVEVADLVAFLHSLTGETAATGRLGKPDRVPSGLPVDVLGDVPEP